MKIDDGTGTGKQAKVNSDNKLLVKATVSSLQHSVSEDSNEAFQVSADQAILATEQNILFIKNTHASKNLVVTFIRVVAAGAAAAGEAAYFNIKVGGDYASGGTAITPTNMYVNSATSASGSFYDRSGSAIVTSGTFTQIDRSYLDTEKYGKEGALILPKNACLLISHKGSDTNGQAYARISFYYDAD